ncbi:hypothetical protein WH47_09705, partial [Habropoda laboriosa]
RPTSQHHTTASSCRFWNFFELSPKEEPCHDAKKCSSSKNIVSSTLLSSNELDSASRTIGLNPRAYGYQFDLKSTPMTCLKVPKAVKQENFTSLLDGNPVPKTLKWKLKGYKTLRIEQAEDFAFVPGGKTYDFDILTKNNEHNELSPNSNKISKKITSGKKPASSKTTNNDNNKDTLCLTTKAIENKEQVECIKKSNLVEVNKDLKSETLSNQKVPLASQLLANSTLKKEEIKFLPISKSELSNQMKYQTQPLAQYSSRPPKKIQISPAPVVKQSSEKGTKKLTPVMEPREEKQPSFVSKLPLPTATQVSESTVSREWSTMENQGPKDTINSTQFYTVQRMHENKPLDLKPRSSVKTSDKNLSESSQMNTYFAPRSSKEKSGNFSVSRKEASELQNRPDYETIMGIPEKPKAVLKIANAGENGNVRTSPCAATQARLQQNSGNVGGQNQSAGSFGPNSSSMSGNSGNGSKKPPGSYPPFTTRRSSSNSSCLTKSSMVSKAVEGGVQGKNNSSSISTSSRNPAPRKCGDDDEPKCNRNRGRQRKCERQERPKCERQERPKCKKEKKTCKRYCCPALQTPMECNYSKFQCPKSKCDQAVVKPDTETDPTCLPNDTDKSREICTKPRRKKSELSCKRERPCKQKRREPSCEREQQPCQKRRSCKRQEQQDCGQTQDQGREICTKPRKRETCKRQRKCNDRDSGRRSAKCTGRRHYTQSAYKNRTKPLTNIKRYSSLPAFAFPLIGMRMNGESKQKILKTPTDSKFYGSDSCSKKDDPCKKVSSCGKKKEDPCKKVSSCGQKKEDPCKKAKASSCGQKKEDPCKKVKASSSCGQKKDPCKKSSSSCGAKKEDPCKKTKSSTTCGAKKPDPCKKSKSSSSCGAKKEDPCKKTKSSTTCGAKKPDPCKKSKSSSSCGAKKEDPCKKTKSSSTCGAKKQDPCKKAKPCGDTKKKVDPCDKSKGKSGDSCTQKRTQVCQDRKKVAASTTSQSESMKDRAERERKEMDECKKSIKDKKQKEEKKAPGLERVVSPCKQQSKDKKGCQKKFSAIDMPLNSLINSMSGLSVRRLVNVSSDRSFSTARSSSNSNDFEVEKSASNENKNYWKLNENDDFSFGELPVPVVTENQEEVQQDNPSFRPNWFLSWFNASYH